jgi:hypothetical protein
MQKITIATIAAGLTLFCSTPTNAVQVTLYDGTGLPGSQGYLAPGAIRSTGLPTTISQTAIPGTGNGVQVNSSANGAEYSGYSNYNPATGQFVNPSNPILDRNIGYTLSFGAVLNTSTDNSLNRSAFSVTVTSSDGLSGIELGFEPGGIFAQSENFTRAEFAPFSTGSFNNYTLTVQGNSYTLSGGSQTLSGALRSYNFNPAASNPPLTFNPYRIANFVSFADNTGQELGTFTLGAASVGPANTAAVPYEFSPAVGVLILGAWTMLGYRKKKEK